MAEFEALLQEELIYQAATNLLLFTELTSKDYEAGWFHRVLAKELEQFSQDVVDEKSPRLIITVPPRHGKSHMTTQRFPVHHMGKNPHHQFIVAAYGQDLANDFSRLTRNVMRDPITQQIFPNLKLDPDRQSVENWSTTQNGGYKPVGVGGPATGRGCQILIIDDPIKDDEQAQSEAYRETMWEWWRKVAYTRLMPGGGVLGMMTRWHHDDWVGRLLEAEKNGGDKWRVVNFPAIAEEDEEFRKQGEALHPERYPIDALKAIKVTLGEHGFESLYQQRPTSLAGGLVKWGWFQIYDESPEKLLTIFEGYRIIQSWDTGNKAKEIHDPSVCLTWLETDKGKLYLLDVFVDRLEFPALKRKFYQHAYEWGATAILVEDKGSGQQLIQDAREEKPDLNVIACEPDADKVVRMIRQTPPIEAGRCVVPKWALWLDHFKLEVTGFPNTKYDDQVDALSQFLKWMTENAWATAYGESQSTNMHGVLQSTAAQASPAIIIPGVGIISPRKRRGLDLSGSPQRTVEPDFHTLMYVKDEESSDACG